MSAWLVPFVLALVFASFVISASVGLGGSLLMVPTLVLAVGPTQGVALAALLLAANNVFKVRTYRRTIPWRAASVVVVCTVVGAALGARLLVQTSPVLVGCAVLVSFAGSLIMERRQLELGQRMASPALALASGATSGFSGTSGPLKGAAIRNLDLDRAHFVGAASVVSFAADATKVAVFTDAELLSGSAYTLAALALPLMAAGTSLGRHLNGRVNERGFAVVFWSVMAGYSVRLTVMIL